MCLRFFFLEHEETANISTQIPEYSVEFLSTFCLYKLVYGTKQELVGVVIYPAILALLLYFFTTYSVLSEPSDIV